MVPNIFIAVELMEFEDTEDAYKFYIDYANLAGFGVKREGKPRKKGEEYQEPQTKRTSFQTGCRAEVKVKYDKKKNIYFFDNVNLEHNHILQPEARMTGCMRAHKTRDEGLMNLLK
ncbi:hypothetical protein U9M48_028608 [Paspalum notatum var. saurae]|uniref:Protein FAR1-RELATED SEQUENCE n=1 Tax=Paspalum notatum var. saurae TaxID=547442 RepID=A0AAQ3TX49_PASNO